MTFQQLIVPDPFIPCQPGWCLQYVRQAFGAPVVEPTATAAWDNAKAKHTDMDFPAGCWVPVWFSLTNEPAGHVALLSPDGSVYSTSDPDGTTPHHHPSMDDLFQTYSRYNPLTYLGWSEDISGVSVVADTQITVESITNTVEDNIMAALNDEEQRELLGNTRTIMAMLNNIAASQNEAKPDSTEVRDNLRKVTDKTVYGQDPQ